MPTNFVLDSMNKRSWSCFSSNWSIIESRNSKLHKDQLKNKLVKSYSFSFVLCPLCSFFCNLYHCTTVISIFYTWRSLIKIFSQICQGTCIAKLCLSKQPYWIKEYFESNVWHYLYTKMSTVVYVCKMAKTMIERHVIKLNYNDKATKKWSPILKK